MKMNQYSSWVAAATAHWEPIIDQTLDDVASQDWSPEYDPADDKTLLKQQLADHLAQFEPAILAYRGDNSRRGPFVDNLMSLLFYIQAAKVAPSPVEPVSTPSAIPGDDARGLFAWWQQDLPGFEGFFQVLHDGAPSMPVYDPAAEPPVTSVDGVFSLGATSAFTDAMASIDALVGDDLGRMESLPGQVQAVTRDRIAYAVFAGADAQITATGVDAKQYMLEDMHVQDVLDEFNWSIRGLNL
nr:hypothetical protein 18 [Saccharospirillaceae bacterium]